jgi:hypothetical protein
VVSGASAAEVLEVRGAEAGAAQGSAVALLPDVDGDGVPELVLGSPGALAGDGLVEIRSGRTLAVILARAGALDGAGRLGSALAAGDDAGSDAFPDVLAGAPRSSPPGAPLAGQAEALKSQAACDPFFDCRADALEPNDDAASASPAGLGLTPALTICAGDVDVFALAPDPGRRMVARVLFSHALGDLDAELRDGTGTLVDASLSLTDDEEVGPFGPDGGPFALSVFGFEGATNAYDLVVIDPDSCPPLAEISDLRVRRLAGGRVLVSWSPSSDPCHPTDPAAVGYRVWAAPDPRPTGPGPFPAGTAFVDVTAQDGDGDLSNPAHEDTSAAPRRTWLVADVGRAGEDGPVGHHGR